MLIVCRNEEQWQWASKMKEIVKNKVARTHYIKKVSKGCKGVIWGNPVIISIHEIKANLMKGARRLQITREDSELVKFEDEGLPKKETHGFMSYTVREYVPNPMRCYKCQRFGHTAKTSKGRRKCVM